MPTWLPATVVEHRPWTAGLFTLVLDRDVPFEAGQFLTLTRDPDGDRHTRRAYSVASAPGEPLEFYIVEVEEGAVSPGLGELRPGDTVYVSDKGKGLFTLAEVPEGATDLWMVATGTGLAPFRSMLRDGARLRNAADGTPEALERDSHVLRRFERIFLVYGARHSDQLGYVHELSALASCCPGRLTPLPLVSREDPGPDALGGRVTDRLRDGSLEATAGATIEPGRSHVLLCGNPAMIKEMQAMLEERGMVRHTRRAPGHLSYEKYW